MSRPLLDPDLAAITPRRLGAGQFVVAGLASIVGFKRLAGRPRDKADLDELREIHGELPIDAIPGLDT